MGYFTDFKIENKFLRSTVLGATFLAVVFIFGGYSKTKREFEARIPASRFNRVKPPKEIKRGEIPFDIKDFKAKYYNKEVNESQKGLEDFCRQESYEGRCDMSNEQDIANIIQYSENKYNAPLANPLSWNEEIQQQVLSVIDENLSQAWQAYYFYRFIVNKEKYIPNVLIKTASRVQYELDKYDKLIADCDTLTYYYVAGLRSIGIEAYVVNVLKDDKGRKISDILVDRTGTKVTDNRIKGKKGYGHYCALVRTDKQGDWLVELTHKGGQDIGSQISKITNFVFVDYKEIQVMHDLQVVMNSNYDFLDVYIERKHKMIGIKLAEALKEMNPNNPKFIHALGGVYYAFGMYDKAENEFRKAVDLSPNNKTYYFNLGVVLQSQKKHNKAIKNIKKSIELDPKNVYHSVDNYECYLKLGEMYSELNNPNKALQYYEKVLKIKPYLKEAKKKIKEIKSLN